MSSASINVLLKLGGVSTLVYLILMFGIANHLRLRHAGTWEDLGRPGLLTGSIANGFQLMGFVFLSGHHRSLNDWPLTVAVWTARFLFLLAIVIFFTLKFSGFGGAP